MKIVPFGPHHRARTGMAAGPHPLKPAGSLILSMEAYRSVSPWRRRVRLQGCCILLARGRIRDLSIALMPGGACEMAGATVNAKGAGDAPSQERGPCQSMQAH